MKTSSINIINKLKLLIVLPLFIICITFIIFSIDSNNKLKNMNYLRNSVIKIEYISSLLNELQKERGLSSGYLSSRGNLFKEELIEQRKNTDRAFFIFIENEKLDKDFYLKKRKELLHIRNLIKRQTIANFVAFDFYTQRIRRMLDKYMKIIDKIENIEVRNYFQTYMNLAIMKESLGKIRGSFNGICSINKIRREVLYRAIHAKGVYDLAAKRLKSISKKSMYDAYLKIISSNSYLHLEHQIQQYIEQDIESININPQEWWQKITKEINKHYDLERKYFMSLKQVVESYYSKTVSKLMLVTLGFLLIMLFVLWLGYKIKNSILRNIRLLNEYKDAVDRSSIVSKTDKRGVITYVNSKFCDISGYKENELLGKPHNIIRHSDMPKEAFAELWDQILNKKAWSGIVKNRKKDGSAYIVEATISPILDHKGKIEEFIAIRNDITENIRLRDEIKNAQKDMIFKMGEIVEHRSAETGSHVRRVAEYSRILGNYYGLTPTEIEHLVLASPMHDIGKVGIPDHILNKPSRLTDEEWEIMKTHTDIGYKLFKNTDKPLLKSVATVIYEHHEKYDGTGYPRGLKGEEIHIFGRITALADVFDAIGSDRCYKKAWKDKEIFEYIQKEKGYHFDPVLVDIFFKHIDEFKEIREKFHDTYSM